MSVRAAMEWLRFAINVHGENLFEAIQDQTGYFGILAPSTLKHRYIFEDMPMSLAPIPSWGKRFDVSVRGIERILRLAVILNGTDYWIRGRTIKKLGIE